MSETQLPADSAGRREVDAPLVDPAATTGLLEVFRRRYLLRLLVRRDITARYQGSFLGMVWAYVNPLSMFCIYFVVIGIILGLGRSVENFGIHMFSGIIIVMFFNQTFNSGTRSITGNKALVSKLAVPREMFPVASMMVSAFHIGPALVIMIVACLVLGWTPDPVGVAALVVALVLIMIFGTALALLFSVANAYFRDFSQAVSVMTNFVRFGVPMIYPFTFVADRFSETITHIYLADPIAQAVLLVQRAFWVGTTSDPQATAAAHLPDHLFVWAGCTIPACLLFLGLAQWVFSRFENKIPELL